ncbi:putative ribonuclease H protein [Vitis vinifera]|uniref:Putative ribonuclease H protein n=1 Tax=Vitis vinifera TaxID=29760 RepID=A0A438HD03_VITVI|nr:putative ribonuclease H protein [Vitis vinifera]
MNGDKAPGPDGFTMAFWQRCWAIVKEEVLEMFKEFYEQSAFIKSMNSTFWFDTQEGGAEILGNSGQSVSWGAVQTIGQGLANRLKKVIGRVVSTDQNAFVMGRQILDASLIANEVAGMDVELYLHSQIFGVGEWSVGRFFPSSKGLRQGDPLSPYLFVMGMEVLSNLSEGSASGLRINLEKSEIIPVGEVEEMEEMAAELGCKLVARRLEKLQRDFLWGGGNLERKVHLVNWEVVCTEKEKGGLGLRKLIPLNKALLGKWIWRFACEKENLWKQVLVAKYGQEGFGWMTKKANGTFGVGVWKEIMKEKDWCWENMAFIWGMVPESDFGMIFGADVQCCPKGFLTSMGWLLIGMLDLVGNLLHTLRGFNPTLEEDAVFWKGGRNGKFKVKEAYNLVVNSVANNFPKNNIWVDKVQTKICFLLGKLLGARCLRLIGSRKEGGISLIGVSCVDVKRKL